VSDPTVLVVDDEENIRHLLSLLLKKEGYAVVTAKDGEQALGKVQQHDFDAILCDLRMPNLDGMGFLTRLSEMGAAATVIVMSAYADIDDALAAIKAGAYDYIAKPFKKDEVLFTLRKAHERQSLKRELVELRATARGAHAFGDIIARSDAMRSVFNTVQKVADYKSTVLLSGESGTGKELVAREIHRHSPRSDRPFITVNCGAIPEHLLESELFGHVKGAFTDASRDKNGLFLEADGGTLFLDEIGDLPLALQVKLLRVLQEGEVRRVGETRPRPVDVRVVAAAVHKLGDLVKEGRFREDLYYRLNVLELELPPLRDRPDDIPLLVDHFLVRHNEVMRTEVTAVSPRAMDMLMQYAWPGNVRELENVIERALVLSEATLIEVDTLPSVIRDTRDALRAVFDSEELSIKKTTRAIEVILIQRALEHTGGNRTAAAKFLELSHRALLYKIKEYFPEGI
jgi:two-component system response regulator AtoC